MKKIIILISVLLLSAVMAAPVFASGRDDDDRGGYRHSDPYDRHGGRGHQSGRDHDGDRYKKYDRNDWGRDRHYEYRQHEHPYKGYRSRPHGRYYSHPYRHKDRDYHYEGHWTSWGDWERYQRIYPDRFRHGRYYRDHDDHLFFRFCDPNGNACLFYSIGR